jgi:hypothetical protein
MIATVLLSMLAALAYLAACGCVLGTAGEGD